jgi:cytochrome c biogenesis protein CcmG, thiol:disulfide interchange protein DsbE
MSRRNRLLGGTLAAVAVVAVLGVFGLADDKAADSGRAAPALPRESLVGGPVTLARVLSSDGHRAALVVFWASWCGPCAKEAPALERFAHSAVGRGRIVGVDWSDAASGARSFIRRYHWSFPNVRDAEGTVGNAYRLTGLPSTFVIDAHGRIRTVLRGPQTASSLKAALAEVEAS